MRRPFIALMLALAIGAVPAARDGAARCSKAVSFGPKWPGTAYVLGAAGPDTILSGNGPVAYATGDGHFGRGANRPIYGQLFVVDRIGVPAADSLPTSVVNAVIVPWDYGADCRPTPWTRSARWLPVGERGLVTGALRERQYWVDGMPTLDVHMPQAQPYPQRVARAASLDSALSADELFTLLEILPDQASFEEAPREAVEPFREWMRAHPALVPRWPVNQTANSLHYYAEMSLLRKTVPPISGTFRFAIARPGQDSGLFFVRTSPHPTSPWRHPQGPRAAPLVEIRSPDSYYVLVATALSERDLPRGASDRAMDREGYIGLVHEPRTRPDGSREWDGQVDFRFIETTLFGDRRAARHRDASASDGVFVMDTEGRIRAEMTIRHIGDQPIILRGERISTTTLDSER